MPIGVLRGPMAVGKTSVAQELAGFFEKVAIVPIDMVCGWRPESESETLLTVRNAAALAQNFAAEGYSVIVDGLFDYPEALSELLSGLGVINGQRWLRSSSVGTRSCVGITTGR